MPLTHMSLRGRLEQRWWGWIRWRPKRERERGRGTDIRRGNWELLKERKVVLWVFGGELILQALGLQ